MSRWSLFIPQGETDGQKGGQTWRR